MERDNAMSEAQFKTLKYQPDYPRRFADYAQAQRWCQDYVRWYNEEHHHSGLNGFTPQQAFTGEYQQLTRKRQATLDEAYQRHPKRFIQGPPVVKMPPEHVYINPVIEERKHVPESSVNFPTLPRANVR